MDETDYTMLTLPGAAIAISMGDPSQGQCPEQGLSVICVIGNRRGMATLGSIIACFYHNAWRQEFLPLTALPFVQREGSIAFSVRVTDEEAKGNLGHVRLLDNQCQFEWRVFEDDLPQLADRFFQIASSEAGLHEHFPTPAESDMVENGDRVVGDASVSVFASAEW